MNQMTSGVYCSAETVACLETKIEVPNLQVCRMGEAHFKGTYVISFW